MSLKAFHFIFILASITLSIYFAFWCLGEYQDTNQMGLLLASMVSIAVAVGLAGYLVWFLKKLKKISFLAFALFLYTTFPQTAQACAVCQGDPNAPMVKGANAGVWLLLAVICTVLSGFAGLFAYWVHRAKRLNSSAV